MKKIHALHYFITVAIIAWSCAPSLKVKSDYDKDANFANYKKFALYNPDNLHEAVTQLNRDRVAGAIKSEMIKRGFQEDAVSPDVLVNAVAIFKDRQSVSATTTGGGGYY